MITALKNGIVFTDERFVFNRVLLIEDQKVKGLVEEQDVPPEVKWIDCKNCFVSAGLIDLQIYG